MARIVKQYDKDRKYYPLSDMNKKYGVRPGLIQEDKHFSTNKFIWRTKPNKTGKLMKIDEVIDMMVDYEYDTICDNLYATSYQDLTNISPDKMKKVLKFMLIPGLYNILYMVFAFRIQYKFSVGKWFAFIYHEEGHKYNKKERAI